MVHRLEDPARPGAISNPMTASLRYRCACGNQEVLQISVVFSATTPEDLFVRTMRDLWRDMQTEVQQHLEEG